jgi:Na+/H+ antiporter NhaC
LPILHHLFWLTLLVTRSFAADVIDIESPRIGLADVPLEISVAGATEGATVSMVFAGINYTAIADNNGRVVFSGLSTAIVGTTAIAVSVGEQTASSELRVLPGWVSVMPAFLAIFVALVIRNVVPALLLGLWLGATTLIGFSAFGAGKGILDVFAVFIVEAINDPGRIAIIVFTMMIGGMVGIITRNGGMASIVRVVVSRAKTAVGGQVSVWLMGLMVFFDDYANTLVVGNTARPITDHLKISREKLAYIVDSTAAPVVCLALVTTWIGYQVSLIDQAMQGIDGLAGTTAYSLFLNSIPYSFYPILAIVFVLAVAVTGRDFGPMYKAELRARRGIVESERETELPASDGDTLEAKPDVPMRPVNAFLPIIVLIISLLVSMYVTGEGESLRDIIGSSDPYVAMIWASTLAVLVAAGLSIGQRILSTHETVDAWYGGARATLFGMIVLVLAWSMSDVTAALNAKEYLISILGDSLPLELVPAVVFILAAVTAFSTGTSWGTMGILLPLVLPLAWAVMMVSGVADASGMHIMNSSIACVLAGAVWGDHCSPISDTTVLSSIASGCDHIEHVRTQMPYALLVGAVAVAVGTVPAGYGMSPWISIIAGAAILVGVLRYLGRKA